MNLEQNGIEKNLRIVRERIAMAAVGSGRNPGEIELVAVTKGFPAEYILKAARAGIRSIGENRAQEAAEKHRQLGSDLPSDMRWHFIGNLQTNKVKTIIGFSHLIHSLDRESLAAELDKRAGEAGKTQSVLIEVNVTGEQAKGGIRPEGLCPFVTSMVARKNIRLEGLMTMAPLGADKGYVRSVFSHLKRLYDTVKVEFDLPYFTTLSMGMTDDFETAVEEGSTMVRIGRAIFGERP